MRPKVIGAIVLAMYQGEINKDKEEALESINTLVYEAIDESVDLDDVKKLRLKDSLRLMGADYDRLSPFIARIINIL